MTKHRDTVKVLPGLLISSNPKGLKIIQKEFQVDLINCVGQVCRSIRKPVGGAMMMSKLSCRSF